MKDLNKLEKAIYDRELRKVSALKQKLDTMSDEQKALALHYIFGCLTAKMENGLPSSPIELMETFSNAIESATRK